MLWVWEQVVLFQEASLALFPKPELVFKSALMAGAKTVHKAQGAVDSRRGADGSGEDWQEARRRSRGC